MLRKLCYVIIWLRVLQTVTSCAVSVKISKQECNLLYLKNSGPVRVEDTCKGEYEKSQRHE